MSHDPDDDLLRPYEVARVLNVRTPMVGLWARLGLLKPEVHTPGGHRRYRRADVNAFRDTHGQADPVREQWEKDAVRLYEQGWPIRRVAAQFNCGYGQMRRILLRRTVLRTRAGSRDEAPPRGGDPCTPQ